MSPHAYVDDDPGDNVDADADDNAHADVDADSDADGITQLLRDTPRLDDLADLSTSAVLSAG